MYKMILVNFVQSINSEFSHRIRWHAIKLIILFIGIHCIKHIRTNFTLHVK